MSRADIGLIGLAVMGQNLVLNMDDHGYTVAVYNRTTSKMEDFINGGAKGTKVIGARTIEELIGVLKKPRRRRPPAISRLPVPLNSFASGISAAYLKNIFFLHFFGHF